VFLLPYDLTRDSPLFAFEFAAEADGIGRDFLYADVVIVVILIQDEVFGRPTGAR